MPHVSGPHNSTSTLVNGAIVRIAPPLETVARTLDEAIQCYEAEFDISIRPCTEPLPGQTEVKYFNIFGANGELIWVVDIHVVRDSIEICPKQDLTFPLLADDHIQLGTLAC
jgi:hypothetical protein